MNTVNIAICDDNMEHIAILEKYLFEISKVKIECDAYQSGESLVNAYKNNTERYDVVFLDMEMKQLNGIETADMLREIDEHIIIVFVSSYTEYMPESFQCQPFRFLVKPINYDELKKAFYDVCEKLSKTRHVFAFSENKTKVRLYCDDIIYCECQNHWVYIHTKDDVYRICKSLSDVYEKLDPSMLYRVHSAFIVNFHYLKVIRNNYIELYHSDKKIPISRSHKKEILTEYTNYIERNLFV